MATAKSFSLRRSPYASSAVARSNCRETQIMPWIAGFERWIASAQRAVLR